MRPSKIIQQDLTYQPAQGEMLYLFPTRMFRGYCPLNREIVVKDVKNIIDGVKEKDPDNLSNNYTTYFYQDAREEMERLPWFTDFANQMKDTYIAFIKQNYDMRVDHLSRHDIHFFCWANLYNEENEHQTHNHLRSLISGTYYPLITDKEAIKFFAFLILKSFVLTVAMEPFLIIYLVILIVSVRNHIHPLIRIWITVINIKNAIDVIVPEVSFDC